MVIIFKHFYWILKTYAYHFFKEINLFKEHNLIFLIHKLLVFMCRINPRSSNTQSCSFIYTWWIKLLWLNGAIWCVLGPPESFLDQRKSIYFSIKMKMNSFTFVYLGYMIYKVFRVAIIRSDERGWISYHIFFY